MISVSLLIASLNTLHMRKKYSKTKAHLVLDGQTNEIFTEIVKIGESYHRKTLKV